MYLGIKATLEGIRLNGRLEERTNLGLGIGGLRADIPSGVTVRLRNTRNCRVGVVTRIKEVLALEVTHGGRIYRSPRRTKTALREELAGAQGSVRIRGLRRGVTALNRLNGLGIATNAGSRLAVGARIRKRTLNTKGTLHLLKAFAHGTLGTRIVAEKIGHENNAAKNKC